MEWYGFMIDEHLNTKAVSIEAPFHAPNSRIHAYVIPVDEGVIIALDTMRWLLSN
jgi:acetate kinase